MRGADGLRREVSRRHVERAGSRDLANPLAPGDRAACRVAARARRGHASHCAFLV